MDDQAARRHRSQHYARDSDEKSLPDSKSTCSKDIDVDHSGNSTTDIEAQAQAPDLLPIQSPHGSVQDAIHEKGMAVDGQQKADNQPLASQRHYEAGDEIYDKFSPARKIVIVGVLCFCAFLAPISSTSILSASPEVVATFHTTASIFDLSNALYLLFMGLSPLLYGPIGTAYGRKSTLIVAAVTFTAFSAGSAAAPNLAAYFIFRMLTAFQGTAFLIVGGTVIGDIYRPVQRGTAYGWFLSGTLIGPAIGPFLGGLIVTYVSWRNIFWLQTGLAGAALVMCTILLPETIHHRRSEELAGLSRAAYVRTLCSWINPWRVITLWKYPNVLVVSLASAALVWNMYSLLTPIRYVLDPRFGLNSPLLAGLFYLAPGAGYFVGTFFGGRWADRVVHRWIKKRNGVRQPEDRLHSCLTSMGVVIPACMIIYGWAIDQKVGGIALPVIVMFIQGVAQLFCFPSLNTYCLDVMQKRSSEVISANYIIRYVFAAGGSAACLPVIDRIGVGWFSTISAGFLVVSAVATWATARWGHSWHAAVERRFDSKEGQ